MDNVGIACGDLFKIVGKADTVIVNCQLSIVHCLRHPAQLWPWEQAFVGFDIHKYDIRADLSDAFPRDHEVIVPAKDPQKPAGAGNDDGKHLPFFQRKVNSFKHLGFSEILY